MKKALFLTLVIGLVSAIPALAAQPTAQTVNAVQVHNDFSFSVNSETNDGNWVIYNADALQDTVSDLLSQLGATNVQVMVGGADANDMVTDPLVSVSFDSNRIPTANLTGSATQAVWQAVTLQGSDNGFAISQILDGVKSHLELSNLQGSTQDLGGEVSYHYTMNALFSQNAQ